MLWKWQSRQRFNQHCDGLGQTVAIRPEAAIRNRQLSAKISESGALRDIGKVNVQLAKVRSLPPILAMALCCHESIFLNCGGNNIKVAEGFNPSCQIYKYAISHSAKLGVNLSLGFESATHIQKPSMKETT